MVKYWRVVKREGCALFGYVMPLSCELKVKHYDLYRAFYCGLCRTLAREYGPVARAALSYDCTFLAVVCAGIGGFPIPRSQFCVFEPFRGRRGFVPGCEALRYAAAVNVLLASAKLDDDVRDKHSVSARAAMTALRPAAKKAHTAYPLVSVLLEDGLSRLHAMEQENCADPDAVCSIFGAMLGDLFRLCPGASSLQRESLGELGNALGRWIYLADAWDDREKDSKSGSYNPMNLSHIARGDAAFLLHAQLSAAQRAAQTIDFSHCRELIDNILTLGCSDRTECLLKSEEPDGSLQDS